MTLLPARAAIWDIHHYMSALMQTTLQLMVHPAPLTGSDGVTYDVDDDTGDADVGHPRDTVLSTHMEQSQSKKPLPHQKHSNLLAACVPQL